MHLDIDEPMYSGNWELNIASSVFPYDIVVDNNVDDIWNTYTVRLDRELSAKIIGIVKESDNLMSVLLTSFFLISINRIKQTNNIYYLTFKNISQSVISETQLEVEAVGELSLVDILDVISKALVNENYNEKKENQNNDFLILQKDVSGYPEHLKSKLRISYQRSHDFINISIRYNPEFYSRNIIISLFKSTDTLFEWLLVNTKSSTKESKKIELLTSKKDLALDATSCIFPNNKTLPEIFEEVVCLNEHSTAIKFQGVALTYGQLNSRVNQLAHYLRGVGIHREGIVSLVFAPSIEMIISLLAVLKAGGAYLPVDFELPKERLRNIINSANCKAVLISAQYYNKLLGADINPDKIYTFEKIFDNSINLSTFNLPHINEPKDLAYIIYTSGSTGKPKGVMIEHESVVRLLKNEEFKFDFDEQDCWTLFHNYSFDFSVWEIFAPLLTGGKLIIIPSGAKKDFKKYLQILDQEKVTILNQTPSAFNNLYKIEERLYDEALLSIRYVIFGGEKLKPKLLNVWSKRYPNCKLINMYGITETTVHATYKEITDLDIENNCDVIGEPLPTLKFYVLDSYMKQVPRNFYGELYISGIGVSRGYLNLPELTSNRFVLNEETNELMYKTGDLVLINKYNELEYIDRVDSQMKIRGYRIELSEIEHYCLRFKDIFSAFSRVIVTDQYIKHIVTYIQAPSQVDIIQLKKFLGKHLPTYMLPSYISQIDDVPLTSNGKIKYELLYNPYKVVDDGGGNNLVFDKKLATIWASILNIDITIITPTSNFFNIGGDSLTAMVLATDIEKEYGVEFHVSELFYHPVFAEMSSCLALKIEKGVKVEKGTHDIKKSVNKDLYNLSHVQKGFYFLHQLSPNTIEYNVTSFFTLKSSKLFDDLLIVFKQLIARHEILRTSFTEIEGIPYQRVHKDINLPITYYEDLSEVRVAEVVKSFVQPFDISTPSLIRVVIIKNSNEGNYTIGVDLHHIITDYISNSTLLQDLVALDKGEQLSEMNLQYKDYAEYCNTKEFEVNKDKQKEYWENKLKNIEETQLELPTDNNSYVVDHKGDSVTFDCPKKNVLSYIEKNEHVNANSFFLSTFMLLLHYITHQKNIVVGVPYYGRKNKEVLGIVGPFINTLAIVADIPVESSFFDFNKEVQKEILDSIENSDISFDELVSLICSSRTGSRNPIFNVLFDYTTANAILEEVEKLDAVSFNRNVTSQFDLICYVTEKRDSYRLELRYQATLFSRETVKSWTSCYRNLLFDVFSNPVKSIHSLSFLSENDKKNILNYSIGQKDLALLDGSIVDMFNHFVNISPNNIAVITESEKYTYENINIASNVVANILLSRGVSKGSFVALLLERGVETVISILGVLKAGAAYIPLDARSPKARLSNILEDSSPLIIITTNKVFSKQSIPNEYDTLFIDELDIETKDLHAKLYPSIERTPQDPMYVIYTSGTTGVPKGVVIRQEALLNRLNWMQKQYPLNNKSIVLFKTPYVFDVSVWELLWWAITGRQLYILSKGAESDPAQIINAIEKNNVSIMHFVPPMLDLFLDYLSDNRQELTRISSLARVFSSGEQLKLDTVNKFYELLDFEHTKLSNLYGPTEACIDVTYYDCVPNGLSVPIGKPIDNVNVYLCNEYGKLVIDSLEGEICIGGKGLAAGYLNNAELTKNKFVYNRERDEILYLTGDIGKRNKDGMLEYIGRLDQQVKIRGHRIEIQEIEIAIKSLDGIKDVVVMSYSNGNELSIAAFVKLENEVNLNIETIKSRLLTLLPSYSIPSLLIYIDDLFLTTNGKVDRKAFKELINDELELDKIGSNIKNNDKNTNYNSQALIAIWEEVLGHKKFDVDDDFFLVGGDSLKMLRLIYKIDHSYKVKLDVLDVFENATINKLILLIGENESSIESKSPVTRYNKNNTFKLSRAQKRIWNASMLNRASPVYNIFQAIILEGALDIKSFNTAFETLLLRHDMLRASFFIKDDEPYQKINETNTIDFDFIDFSETSEDVINMKIDEYSKKVFDLLSYPLLKVVILKLSEIEYCLLVNMHHIISDGWSLNIIFRDFSELYAANLEGRLPSLPKIKTDYRQLVRNQNDAFESELYNEHLNYWRTLLHEEITPIFLNRNLTPKTATDYIGSSIPLFFNDDISDTIDVFCKSHRITYYMFMVSILNILLYKYTSKNDIVIGSFVAGREDNSIEQLVGCFVNTILLRNRVLPELDCLTFFGEVKENSLKALKYQNYPYEELLANTNWSQKIKNNQIFRIAINVANYNIVKNSRVVSGISITQKELDFTTSKFDLTLHVSTRNSIYFEYNTAIYSTQTIEKFSQRFLHLIKKICHDPSQLIGDIEMQYNLQELPPIFKPK